MAALSVLFGRLIETAEVARAMRDAGLSDGASASTLVLEGEPAELHVVPARVAQGMLDDAAAQSGWTEAAAVTRRHIAHVRLVDATSKGASPLHRLLSLTRAAGALLSLPGALALLDETGRSLTGAAEAARRLDGRPGIPPLELWISLRSFELADAQGFFLDTLGMAQLDLPDLEAYAADGLGASTVAAWLRNLGLYLVQQGLPLKSGDTLDGPDEEPWVVLEDGATVEPARRVLRFSPVVD